MSASDRTQPEVAGTDASLRDEFVRLLTEDGPTNDMRRRDYNQAIFAPENEGGWAVYNGTTLSMVLEKFDRAVRNCAKRSGDVSGRIP